MKPSCPRCGSPDTEPLRNFGRPVPGRFQCLGCKRWFGPENPPDAGGTGEPEGVAASPAMPTRKPHPIQAVATRANALTGQYRLTRPGARYAVHRVGDARPGAWLPDGEALQKGWTDVYPENEARALLPFLRATGHGRKASDPTTADGRLVARACKRLGLTAAGLAEKIGAHESVLSRARNGELPAKHREAIRALLRGSKE